MDLIFNELSLHHKTGCQFEAKDLMRKLLFTCKAANTSDFKRLRVKENFFQLLISKNYMIVDWLNDCSVRNDYKTLLLGLKRYPFIEEGDENIENLFILNYYYLISPELKELHMKETEGLAVAFLYNTFSLSFATNELWGKTRIELLEKTDKQEKSVFVKNISCPEHIESHREWIDSNRPVKLIKSDILPEEKIIHIRDDHGKDVLSKIAMKLIKSPYIVKIINSLPFNQKKRNIIRRIYPDGKIEIVLIWTNPGYGMIIQTTGRNLQETKKISEMIEKKLI